MPLVGSKRASPPRRHRSLSGNQGVQPNTLGKGAPPAPPPPVPPAPALPPEPTPPAPTPPAPPCPAPPPEPCPASPTGGCPMLLPPSPPSPEPPPPVGSSTAAVPSESRVQWDSATTPRPKI